MAKASKQENTVEPKAEKAAREPAKPKVPVINIPRSVGVRQLADLLQVDSIQIIKQLMRNGIMANINQIIDYDTAAPIITGLGFQPHLQPLKEKQLATAAEESKKLKKLYTAEAENLQPRPPVVTVMGHVNHGKTKLLDAIRQTNVVDSEAGGITQHIGAYQATISGQKITFLDTPGHEAFTAMRAHGANITDITILVVAADDGVMPQTIEAINHARAAEVPIVVAINKIDKENANVNLVKQQLADAGLVLEEWGGQTVGVEISAKEKIGIPELLESVLLVAEMEELKANPNQPAAGVVIEAEMDKNRGPLATVLIQTGTLKEGDTVVVGRTWGRVRAMFNDIGKRIKKADPSTPAEVLGLNSVPFVGDTLRAVTDERHAQALVARNIAEAEKSAARGEKSVNLNTLYDQISAGKMKELNVILKTDVQGSIEPIRGQLEQLATEEVKVRIIHAATGNISESDVMLATASRGLIIGFNVTADEGARRLASARTVDIRFYDVIYTLADDINKALKGMLEPTFVEVIDGTAEVRAVFPAAKGAKVVGVYVTDGKVTRNVPVRVRRGKELLADSTVSSLKRFKDDAKEVAAGYECGIGVKDFNDFAVGDTLEFYRMEKSG
ncbi:MAG TPA: translation initiation factor IF-2 [Dehalococcoidales bacterium]|nr:MAG: translation initiation factor IF-2 [Chloroflexi bacterium RBG_16_60_22]HJX13891.1 translation initiation factor IF-2 [Dehalococcoidales bacterium]